MKVCSICQHPQRREIERALANQTSYRNITVQFETSASTVTRHVKHCIPEALEAARQAQAAQAGLNVEREIARIFAQINKVLDACDEWLTDPDDPEKYTLDARSSELHVIYDDYGDVTEKGQPKRKRSLLSDLLAKVEGLNIEVGLVATKKADPRDLIVKTAGEIRGQLELYARLNGLFQKDRQNEADRQHDREVAARVRAEVAKLREEGWDEATARAIILEAEPEASRYLN